MTPVFWLPSELLAFRRFASVMVWPMLLAPLLNAPPNAFAVAAYPLARAAPALLSCVPICEPVFRSVLPTPPAALDPAEASCPVAVCPVPASPARRL